MQIETNVQVRKAAAIPAAPGRSSTAPGSDFLTAINAAGSTSATPQQTRREPVATHDTDPAELYRTATGREVEETRDELPPYCTDSALSTFLGGGIDTTKPINWYSKGDKELTAEQIAELKEKYNVKNLTRQDYYDLMSDLTQMEVLAGVDCARVHLAVAPPPGRYFCPAGFSSFGPSRGFRGGSLVDYFSDTVEKLTDSLAEFRRLNPGLPKDGLDWLEGDIAPRQRMLDLLTQLL